MLVGIISQPSSITCQNPLGTSELWPLNCPKTELAVSALQVEYPAPKNVNITIEFTTNMTGVFCVSLSLLFKIYFEVFTFMWSCLYNCGTNYATNKKLFREILKNHLVQFHKA